ncbi:hypothetical protein H1164_16720 [Thermoactinomyces daqus]|uniref:Uncharacterized protein n=1 Tax=Thermoactinomyces daqus TaxID=1329516 RepID=A0A7W1XDD6_9BACL|nr:hypothetical protein [Thermoactinomyces daqus]MBA4544478.1 hypothetical protein [Thermoactinomyces daqus]
MQPMTIRETMPMPKAAGDYVSYRMLLLREMYEVARIMGIAKTKDIKKLMSAIATKKYTI